MPVDRKTVVESVVSSRGSRAMFAAYVFILLILSALIAIFWSYHERTSIVFTPKVQNLLNTSSASYKNFHMCERPKFFFGTVVLTPDTANDITVDIENPFSSREFREPHQVTGVVTSELSGVSGCVKSIVNTNYVRLTVFDNGDLESRTVHFVAYVA
jgi:hypothetical protein